jgi:hypothetical protein
VGCHSPDGWIGTSTLLSHYTNTMTKKTDHPQHPPTNCTLAVIEPPTRSSADKRIKVADTTIPRRSPPCRTHVVVLLHQGKAPDAMKTPRPSKHNARGPRFICGWTPPSFLSGGLATPATKLQDLALFHKLPSKQQTKMPHP